MYDDTGALLTDGTRSFTYDALGRLTGVSGGGHTAAYLLDGDGRRVSQTIDSVTTLLDLDLRGELSAVLVAGDAAYLPGMASLGSSDGTDWTATLADAQGSVLATVDAAGTMGLIARYDPYGGPRPSTTLPVGIGFTGEWTDPAGLVDLRARVYDPSLQAFLSRDTFGGIPTIPSTGNRHAYALGDPLRFTDPSGHFVAALTPFMDRACTVETLSCDRGDFAAMTIAERIAWMDAFQLRWNTEGWFNNVRGILRFAQEKGLDDSPWFSELDAAILEGIVHGKGMHMGRILESTNPGSRLWLEFFRDQEAGAGDDALRSRWGPAEQASTDYGWMLTGGLTRSIRVETTLITIGNVYRHLVGTPEQFRSAVGDIGARYGGLAGSTVCGVMGIGVICGEIGAAAGRQFVGDLSDDLLDPRNEHAAYQFAHWIFDATTPLDW